MGCQTWVHTLKSLNEIQQARCIIIYRTANFGRLVAFNEIQYLVSFMARSVQWFDNLGFLVIATRGLWMLSEVHIQCRNATACLSSDGSACAKSQTSQVRKISQFSWIFCSNEFLYKLHLSFHNYTGSVSYVMHVSIKGHFAIFRVYHFVCVVIAVHVASGFYISHGCHGRYWGNNKTHAEFTKLSPSRPSPFLCVLIVSKHQQHMEGISGEGGDDKLF